LGDLLEDLPLGVDALVPRHVADQLTGRVSLVPRLALMRLPRRRGVRIRVVVQEIGVLAAAVGRRGAWADLAVRPDRRLQDDEPLAGGDPRGRGEVQSHAWG